MIASVEDAVKMNANAFIAMGYIGTGKDNGTLENLGLIARKCEKLGMPLVAEMIPAKSERISNPCDVEAVGLAARMGAELGAAVVKTLYTGSEDTFREVVSENEAVTLAMGSPSSASNI